MHKLISASGSILGSITSDRKAKAARENGKKGGRPKKKPPVAEQEPAEPELDDEQVNEHENGEED